LFFSIFGFEIDSKEFGKYVNASYPLRMNKKRSHHLHLQLTNADYYFNEVD